jgi:hypothetical protein
MDAARDLFTYRKHWATALAGAVPADVAAEMDELGWDAAM